jgi:PST family polysaccharide transporter
MDAIWVKYLPKPLRSKLGGRQRLQDALGNTIWLVSDRLLRLGVGLFVSVWIARYLGPEQYGLWSYALAFSALFTSFTSLGLEMIVVRELVKAPEQEREILGSAFVLRVAGATVTLIGTVTAISLLRPDDTLILALVALSSTAFIFQALYVIDLYFLAKVKSKYTIYAAHSAFLLMTLVKVGLLLTSAPLISFALAGLGETAMTALLLILVYKCHHRSIRSWRFSKTTARHLIQNSWPLILSGFTMMVYTRIDQIMIGEILGDREVGLYSTAVRISELWYFIPIAILDSVFPAVIQSKTQSETLYLQRMQTLFRLMVLPTVCMALVMTFASGTVIRILFGPAYQASGAVLAINIWAGVFFALGAASERWFAVENLQRYSLYRTGCGCIANVLLNLILIPRFNILGAAVATVISQMVASLLFDLFNKRTRPLFWMKLKAFLPVPGISTL